MSPLVIILFIRDQEALAMAGRRRVRLFRRMNQPGPYRPLPGDQLQYVDARLDDLGTIVEIYNSTIPTRMVTADTEPVSVEDRREWFFDHSPERRPLWVVKQDGVIIGWVSFQSFYGRPAYEATAEISIYLRKEMRGKGIGREALRYAIARSPHLGIRTLLGFIFAHNEASIRVFRNCGFEEWAVLPNIAVLDGVERTLKILGRRVS
jgi:phosphinothricin acetyltransferase